MQNPAEENEEISLYKKRYFLLVVFCFHIILCMFLSNSFGTSNQILAAYFNVSLAEIDWAIEGLYGGTVVATPIFAYLCYKDKTGFRTMSITGTICMLVSNIVIVLSIIFPVLFPLMLASTFFQGVAYIISQSVGTFFAVLWFPENQVDFVIALTVVSTLLGILLGSTLPVIFLQQPPQINATTLFINASTHWNLSTYRTLLSMYSVVSVILVCLLLVFITYASDLPPKPPTLAMLLKRKTDLLQAGQKKTFSDFLTVCTSLFKDIHFGIIAFVLNISYFTPSMLILIMSQLVDVVTEDLTLKISPALLSGLIVSTYIMIAIVSSFVVAKCLKVLQIYTTLSRAGTLLLFFSGLIVFLSYYYKNLVALFISNLVLAIGSHCVDVSLFVVVTRHTYPISEIFVSVWVTGIGALVFLLLAVIQRSLSMAFSLGTAIIELTVVLFISFVLSLVMKPKNKRKEAEENAATESNELTPILAPDR